MPAIIQQLLSGNFSAPLTLIFVLFTLLALYFLFRLGVLFFVRGDEFTDSVEGKRQTKSLVRLLVISLFIALFTGFIFQFVSIGQGVAEQNAPTAARSFFNWLLGR